MVKKALLSLMAIINLFVGIFAGYKIYGLSIHGIGEHLVLNMNNADWVIAAFFRVFMSGSIGMVFSFGLYLINSLIYRFISADEEDLTPLRFAQTAFIIIMMFSIVGAIKLFIVKPQL